MRHHEGAFRQIHDILLERETREAVRITGEHIDQLNETGYVLVDDFLSPRELAACQAEVGRYFPSCEEFLADPQRHASLEKVISFPFAGEALNEVTTHPEIMNFLERLYGTADLRLGESALQVKYGRRVAPGTDQFLHTDAWGKKSSLYPREEGLFRQTFMIVYYCDVTAELGPTRVLSWEHTRGMPLLAPGRHSVRRPEDYPALYAQEEPILARAGSLLVFTAATLHRGTAVSAQVGQRYAHFITYHAAASSWMQSHPWPSGTRPHPDSDTMRRFVERATPSQRALLGFPCPGHPYWNDETIGGVAQRYPGMDTGPYKAAIGDAGSG
ncbi:phytanoyl-CoA dioxygenase family protein (plasmid) [Streptosporangium sp. NBC_01495]|uniref:phytanoyl-CoA dioxygenase family protein n=1 Tax=Streptosporangium sp. NBC_01495 TaxID=2903899 RepID=UPI002E36816D|nr:phytanoyl-CoA dioxygenase family protein [Streptosporangium sp. NBC_01495]